MFVSFKEPSATKLAGLQHLLVGGSARQGPAHESGQYKAKYKLSGEWIESSPEVKDLS